MKLEQTLKTLDSTLLGGRGGSERLCWFLVGVGVGTVVSLLLAPRAGEVLRKCFAIRSIFFRNSPEVNKVIEVAAFRANDPTSS